MTFLGAAPRGLLLAVLNRRSSAPHRRLLQATAALTPLSCVRSVAWPDDVPTKVALIAVHRLAAAVIVPVLVRHAHDRLARHASRRLPRCTGQVVRR
jgi:hypothetical protein